MQIRKAHLIREVELVPQGQLYHKDRDMEAQDHRQDHQRAVDQLAG